MARLQYAIGRQAHCPAADAGWDAVAWQGVPALAVASFRPESSDHRPRTQLRLCHDGRQIAGLFRVEDRFVVSRHTGFQQPVWRDSCVELFLQPQAAGGYFNAEFNAGGALLLYWIEDPQREGDGFRRYTVLPDADCRRIAVHASLPARVEPELSGPLTWTLGFVIPLALLESYAGPLRPLSGQCWRGNAYKCADGSSHPHWAAWSPVDVLDFHRPACFGEWQFG